MNEVTDDNVRGRERSPSFPAIGLTKAVERTRELHAKAKRFPVLLGDVGPNWGMTSTSSAVVQNIAALLAYGLLESERTENGPRRVRVSEMGWRILEDARPGVRDELLAQAARRPKLLAEYIEKWGADRPDDAHAISQLKFDSHLSDDAAARFLRVFDENRGFTSTVANGSAPIDGGKSGSEEHAKRDSEDDGRIKKDDLPLRRKVAAIMDGERELTTGLLSKGASFRLIVSGKIGEKEIDRLIRKLVLDKEILSDPEEDDSAPQPGAHDDV